MSSVCPTRYGEDLGSPRRSMRRKPDRRRPFDELFRLAYPSTRALAGFAVVTGAARCENDSSNRNKIIGG